MPTYAVEVYREWKEYGEVEIEADSEDDAQEKARELLADDDPSITWKSDEMEPGQEWISTVEEVD